VSRVDLSFGSMGTEARVRLECESLSAAELEGYAAVARAVLDDVERALSRFRPDSELCAVNRDPRSVVPVSPVLGELARAASWARSRSGGLVDATLLGELEEAGYAASRAGIAPAPLDEALRAAPPRRPARRRAGSAALRVDAAGRLHRAPGVRLDSGGLGKGLAADLAAALLPSDVRYAISCGGDLAVGGPGGAWEVAVAGARTGAEGTRLRVRGGGVATSGIHARLWQRADGGFGHHVLDPSTGRPAWTGLVAVTAVASSALEVEVLAKTALLSGPHRARAVLFRRGGVLQHDDGRVEVLSGVPVVRLRAAA
jgi:thiamine biosynthesis lipoprotein